jgi:hypothetical protein
VTAADLSGRQIDTARWLLKAIERRARKKSLPNGMKKRLEKLYELKADIEKLELRMRQDRRSQTEMRI